MTLATGAGMPSLRPIGLLSVAFLLLAVTACNPETTPGEGGAPTAIPSVSATLIPAEDAVAAIEGLAGGFRCDEPRPRSEDFWWLCTGSQGTLDAEVRVYARQVDDPVTGVTMYLAVPQEEDAEQAAQAATELAQAVVEVAVPEEWRASASEWIAQNMPDGGRTLDVPGSGLTAGVQPLTANEWYVELWELAGQPA